MVAIFEHYICEEQVLKLLFLNFTDFSRTNLNWKNLVTTLLPV